MTVYFLAVLCTASVSGGAAAQADGNQLSFGETDQTKNNSTQPCRLDSIKIVHFLRYMLFTKIIVHFLCYMLFTKI